MPVLKGIIGIIEIRTLHLQLSDQYHFQFPLKW